MRSTSDGGDPHEGGGQHICRLAAGVHDEAALYLHVGVLEANFIGTIQSLGIDCH